MKGMLRTFIKYPVLGNSILALIFLFGYFGFKNLRTTFFPPIPSRIITVQASYPGASPEEIEEAIVLKIEDNLKGVTGIERTTSVSRENSCSIVVEVLTGYDIDVVLQDVKNAVNQVSSFPVGMERLTIFKREMRNFAIDFVFYGDVPLKTLKSYARRAERDLLASEGLSKVSLSGFPDEEIEIALRESDLRAFGMTFQEVANAVRNANVKTTGGKIKGKNEELLIRANVKGYTARELENHVIRTTDNGAVVRLKDVADCTDRWSENPDRVYYNGRPAVRVTVQNLNEEDLFHVTKTTKAYIERFNDEHERVKAAIVRDGSDTIMERIKILSTNGVLGLLLVLMFLSLSLNPRMAFWVALAIPLSFAGMFMLSAFYNLTINVMSLMAMILVLGILVDDGIVIAENIYQHHERGQQPIQAAVEGTLEVLPAVTASIMTTIVIFVTFFFLEGGLGDRSRDLAFVVIATLAVSLVEGIFILPSHIAHSKALTRDVSRRSQFEVVTERLLFSFRDKIYGPALRFVIRYPLVAISVVVALFMITLGAMQGSIIRTTYFPIIERRNVDIELEMPAGTPVSVTESLLTEMEAKAWRLNTIYRDEEGGDRDLIPAISRSIGPGTHVGELRIELLPTQYRKWSAMQIQNRLRELIGRVPDAERLVVGGRGFWGAPVSVAIQSNDLDQLRGAKEQLKEELKRLAKLKDVSDDDPPGLREIHLQLKEKAFALGLNTAEVMRQVRNGFFGSESQRLLRGIDEVKIWVRYQEDDRSTIQQLEQMRIRLPGGKEYPLLEIADFTLIRGVMSINHINAQRVVQVEADITDDKDSVPDIIDEIRRDVLPGIAAAYPDVRFDFEGQSRENAKTNRAFNRVLPPVLLLMFFIIVITFRSFAQASIVFLLIPFSLIGVLWGHFFQGYVVSMLSIFGTVALLGIVVNDSLVFVNAMNRLLKQGLHFKTALYQAGLSRFRPVWLTSITTIAGLGPLIFEPSRQAQFLSPMAISVAYGLLFGTFLTLLMLPALLAVNNHLRRWLVFLFRGERPTAECVEPAVREEVFTEHYNGEAPCNPEHIEPFIDDQE